MVNWKICECLVIFEATTGNEADLDLRKQRPSVCIGNYVLVAVVNFWEGFHRKKNIIFFQIHFESLDLGQVAEASRVHLNCDGTIPLFFEKFLQLAWLWALGAFVFFLIHENAKYVNNIHSYVLKLIFLHNYEGKIFQINASLLDND